MHPGYSLVHQPVVPAGFSVPMFGSQDDADIYFGALALAAIRRAVVGASATEMSRMRALRAVDDLRDALIAAQVITDADYEVTLDRANIWLQLLTVTTHPLRRLSDGRTLPYGR